MARWNSEKRGGGRVSDCRSAKLGVFGMFGSEVTDRVRCSMCAVAALLVVAGAGCGSDASSSAPVAKAGAATSADEFSPSNFDEKSITVDNKYFPLEPGAQYTFEGNDSVNGVTTPHRVVFTVTDLVKKIDGVNVVVVWDRDFVRDELEESELTFFAQDTTGTVWHLGQYREQYEGLEFTGGRAWMVGHLEGAKAGIFMLADPGAGTPSYSEGYAPPPYYWTDRAQVDQVGQTTTVPAGTYDDVLVTKEFNDQEPGAIQLKYYAPGIGNVRVGWTGDDTEQENLQLVKVAHLDDAALADARSEALKLEAHANVYGSSPPAESRR